MTHSHIALLLDGAQLPVCSRAGAQPVRLHVPHIRVHPSPKLENQTFSHQSTQPNKTQNKGTGHKSVRKKKRTIAKAIWEKPHNEEKKEKKKLQDFSRTNVPICVPNFRRRKQIRTMCTISCCYRTGSRPAVPAVSRSILVPFWRRSIVSGPTRMTIVSTGYPYRW